MASVDPIDSAARDVRPMRMRGVQEVEVWEGRPIA
jgi:hypothetical protein